MTEFILNTAYGFICSALAFSAVAFVLGLVFLVVAVVYSIKAEKNDWYDNF